MIDFEDLLLGPVYDTQGYPGTLTDKSGTVHPVTLLDHRDGIDHTTARGGSITVINPGISQVEAVVFVRHSDCPEKPVGWRIAFDGEDESYEVRGVKLKGRPGRGEWRLTLQRED